MLMRIPQLILTSLLVISGCGHRGNVLHSNMRPENIAANTSSPRAPGQFLENAWSDNVENDGMTLNSDIGTIDPYIVSAKVEDSFGEINRCFDSNTTGMPYVGGALTIKLEIDQSGYAKIGYIQQSDLGSYLVESCILSRLKSLYYSKPRGGRIAHAEIPFKFRAEKPVARAYLDEHFGAAIDSAIAEVDEDTGAAIDIHEIYPVTITAYVTGNGTMASYGISGSVTDGQSLPQDLQTLMQRVVIDKKHLPDKRSSDITKYSWTLR